MNKRHELTGADAVRLLCNAVQMTHYFEKNGEGFAPACRDNGELILQDALMYLAYGDTTNARSMIERYEEWQETGKAGWPYHDD